MVGRRLRLRMPFNINIVSSSLKIISLQKNSGYFNKRPLKEAEMGKVKELLLYQKFGVYQKTYFMSSQESALWEDFLNRQDFFIKKQAIKELQLISSYKGLRHKTNMPVRGQRTHTNAKTRRRGRVS